MWAPAYNVRCDRGILNVLREIYPYLMQEKYNQLPPYAPVRMHPVSYSILDHISVARPAMHLLAAEPRSILCEIEGAAGTAPYQARPSRLVALLLSLLRGTGKRRIWNMLRYRGMS